MQSQVLRMLPKASNCQVEIIFQGYPKIGWTSVVPGWVWNPQFHDFNTTTGHCRSHLAAGSMMPMISDSCEVSSKKSFEKLGWSWNLVISGWSMASHPHLRLISRHFLSASARVQKRLHQGLNDFFGQDRLHSQCPARRLVPPCLFQSGGCHKWSPLAMHQPESFKCQSLPINMLHIYLKQRTFFGPLWVPKSRLETFASHFSCSYSHVSDFTISLSPVAANNMRISVEQPHSFQPRSSQESPIFPHSWDIFRMKLTCHWPSAGEIEAVRDENFHWSSQLLLLQGLALPAPLLIEIGPERDGVVNYRMIVAKHWSILVNREYNGYIWWYNRYVYRYIYIHNIICIIWMTWDFQDQDLWDMPSTIMYRIDLPFFGGTVYKLGDHRHRVFEVKSVWKLEQNQQITIR